MSLFLSLFLTVLAGDVWPGFLGAGANIKSSSPLPLKWSPTENIAWSIPLPGHGQSSPVIWNDKIFLSAVDGPMKETYQVSAFGLADGKELWKVTLQSTDPVENSVYVSRAAPTPVVDQDRVIVFFESGDLISLDHSGKELWKRSLSQDYGKFKNKFGLSGSPAQTSDSLFILIDDEGPSYLVAIDKKTGKTTWKQDRTSRASWSSPALVIAGGVPQIVVSSAGSIDGYEASTGKLLWTYTDIGGNTGTTPIDQGEGRFFVAASGGRGGENTAMAKKSNGMMQISKTNDVWNVSKAWVTDEATPAWASPILHQGCAYWVNNVGVIFCFDASTGKLNYKQRAKQESCWATPFAIGDRVYFFGKGGMTTVLAAGPEFKVLAENQLWDPDSIKPDEKAGEKEPTEERRRAAAMFSGPTVYGVAVADGRIVIRIGEKLFCIR